MGFRYDWQGASPVKEVDVAKNPSARVEAIIYAPETPNDKISALPLYLTNRGFICYLDEVGGRNVLKVARIDGKEEHLIETLRSGGYVFGEPNKTEIPDKTPELSTIAKIRKNGLNISGIFGDIGHINLAISGKLESDKNRIATAALYGASATVSAIFGTGVGAIRFAEMVSHMRDDLAKNGINLTDPAIITPEIQYRERNTLQKTYDFIKKYPIQIANSISLVGNISLLQSGLREIRNNKTGYGRFFAGIVTAMSALIAMFMPQATAEEIATYKKEGGFVQRLREGKVVKAVRLIPRSTKMLIARSPLAFQGLLLLSDNMGMIFDAYQTSQKYEVWEKGGEIPSFTQKLKNTITHKPMNLRSELSHADKIKEIDAELHRLGTSNPDTYNTVAGLMNKRKLLSDQMGVLANPARKKWGKISSSLTAGTYTAASLFNAVATKNRDKSLEKPEVYNELYTYAANAVLDIPSSQQGDVIKKMALYLSTESEVRVRETEIENGIKSKLAVLKQSPWMHAVIEIEEEAAAEKYPPPMSSPKAEDTSRIGGGFIMDQPFSPSHPAPPSDTSVTARIDQLQAYANDPANASDKPLSKQAQPDDTNNSPHTPNPTLDSVTVGTTPLQQTGI